MDKNYVWLLTGKEQFAEVFATKELAIATLQLGYSGSKHSFELRELDGAEVLGITIKRADREYEDLYALAKHEILTNVGRF